MALYFTCFIVLVNITSACTPKPGSYLTSCIFIQDYEYLIKWRGWPLDSVSWEPSSNLTTDLIRFV